MKTDGFCAYDAVPCTGVCQLTAINSNVSRFIRRTKKYLYLETQTPTILNDMVNAVYVHAPDKSSGHQVRDVTTSYNYTSILLANLLYDVKNGKAA